MATEFHGCTRPPAARRVQPKRAPRNRAREFAGFTVLAIGIVFAALPFVPGGLALIAAGVAMVGADHPRLRPHIVRCKLLRHKVMRWKRRKERDMKRLTMETTDTRTKQKWLETGIVLLIAAMMFVATLPFGAT